MLSNFGDAIWVLKTGCYLRLVLVPPTELLFTVDFVFLMLGGGGALWLSREHFDSLSKCFFWLHLLKDMAALVHGLKSGFLAEFPSFFLLVGQEGFGIGFSQGSAKSIRGEAH